MAADHIMVDIESLDTSPTCVILTIGAVLFDPKGMGITDKLELRPVIDEQTEKFNRTISDSTIKWWSTQSPEAIEEAMGDQGRESLRTCMERLHKFCWNRKAIWSHGAPFDVVAMETAFRQLEMNIPWQYWTVRDTRTLFDITGVSLKDGGHVTTHKAVEDAERQVIVVQSAYRKLIKAGLVAN